LDKQIVGAVRIGIKMEEVRREQQATVVRIIILIVILTLMAMGGVLLLSRHFGGAHYALAARLRGIMAHAPLQISIVNQKGQLLAISNQAERLFGFLTKGQLLTEYLEKKLSPTDIEKLTKSNDIVFADGRPLEQEMEIELHGQSHVWYVSKFAIAHDASGQPSLICTFVHDITERKRAEQERFAYLHFLKVMDSVNRAIQESSDLEQMMSSVLDVVLVTFDCDRAFLLYPCDPASPTWKVPTERTRPEYPGVLSLGHEMDMDPHVAETFAILLAADGPVKFGPGTEFALPAEVSEQFGIKCFMSMALYPKTGSPWQFGVHQCSHERTWTKGEERFLQEIGRRLEDALTSLLMHKNLHESEARYRLVFENSPVSLWEEDFSGVRSIFDDLKGAGVTDIEAYFDQHPDTMRKCAESVHIVDVNQATLALHGATSKEELLDGLVQTFTPQSFAVFRRELIRLWNGGTEMREDAVVQTLTGEQRDVSVYFSVCPGHEKNLSKVIVSLVNISERKQAEQERETMQEQLLQAQKMESVGRLAGGVAHDYNNMLSVILPYSEMAMEEVDPTQPLYRRLQEIHSAAQRSADLTRQLLAFARKQAVTPRVLDLNETVASMLKLLRKLIGEDISLVWMPGAELWPVRIDPSQIDQVMANLCVNARDAITGVGKVIIETQNITFDEAYCNDHADALQGNYVLLVVSDNGCGMDRETLNKIFEPFFTTKEMGKGTGLGLATIYGIVKQNNGFINVYSEPGFGSTFKIYLPRHVVEGEVIEEQSADSKIAGGSETILLVEDEAAVLDMVKNVLEGLGYTVFSASLPGEALRTASERNGDFDLLITDVVMPEMTGQELSKSLIASYPAIKCLFMSGYTGDVIAPQGIFKEGINYIQKPFSRQDLAGKVRSVLDGK
jgi:PAS domain S-box-containing protein